MKRLYLLVMVCMFLMVFIVGNAGAKEAQKPKETSKESIINKPKKAKPVEMPQAASKRDQVSATGYHDKEVGEETQEMPNPLDNTSPQITDPLKDPVR
ncbi:MAG: hypothetical protein GX654_02250 [Desulfatiglans sp.]|jgi:hypothetical protein|nr:hypothetical protein [Desulfatiglans sp.]